LCISLLGFSPNPKYITESDEYHVVKKGDTLYSIAKKYETTVDALKRINNLPSDKILIGQKIYLRNKEHPHQYYVTKRDIPSNGYHVIQKGETLYRLSKMYNVPIELLM
jgi:LysM repeat protein